MGGSCGAGGWGERGGVEGLPGTAAGAARGGAATSPPLGGSTGCRPGARGPPVPPGCRRSGPTRAHGDVIDDGTHGNPPPHRGLGPDPGQLPLLHPKVMGMRLVKRSVNQDDVSAYHLFYADAWGPRGPTSPSSTGPSPGRCGGPGASWERASGPLREVLDRWRDRLAEGGLPVGRSPSGTGGRRPGLRGPGGAAPHPGGGRGGRGWPVPWEESPVPGGATAPGLGPIVLSVPDVAGTSWF
jgi:catechol 2,3-dioxygenase-like lactoylglutathione lyase family enzyme